MSRSVAGPAGGRALAGASVALMLALGAASCGGGDDTSVRAEPETTTTTTAVTTPSGDGQVVTYQGVQLTVPTDWPVYDLAAEPTRCVRADQHAVYLGQQGPTPDCPARVVGRTETVQIEKLDARSQLETIRATETSTLNGIAVRVDPDPDTNGALTAVLTDQNLAVIITYGDRAVADAALATLALA